MDIRYFLSILAATLVGGMVGRYLASRLRANNKQPILRIHLSTHIERALMSFCAFLVVFTLAQDVRTMFGADWDLWIIGNLEAKYGFLLGVILVSIGGDFLRRKNQLNEVNKADPKRNVA